MTLLRKGYWLTRSSGKVVDNHYTLWLGEGQEPLTDQDEILRLLSQILPEPFHGKRIINYCPQFITSQRCIRWIISPELRIEFSDWMGYGFQGLYVCGISTLKKYADHVVHGENKFTAYLKHVFPHYLPKIDKQPMVNPKIIFNNRDNPFRLYHRMKTFEEDFHIDSDSGSSSKSEE